MPKVFPERLTTSETDPLVVDVMNPVTDPVNVTVISTTLAYPPELKGRLFNRATGAVADFFDEDLVPTNAPCTFRICVTMNVAGVIAVMRTQDAQQFAENLNAGVALVGGCAYEFNITVAPDQTINLQYSGAGVIVSCIVVELYA